MEKGVVYGEIVKKTNDCWCEEALLTLLEMMCTTGVINAAVREDIIGSGQSLQLVANSRLCWCKGGGMAQMDCQAVVGSPLL